MQRRIVTNKQEKPPNLSKNVDFFLWREGEGRGRRQGGLKDNDMNL